MRTSLALFGVCTLLVAAFVPGCDNGSPGSPEAPRSAPEKRIVKKEPTHSPADEATGKPQPKAQVVIEPHAPASDDGILAPDLLDSSRAEVPTVVMSQQHQETCLVNVGDTMPDARLTDLNGKEQELSKLLGDRLTVVFFWTAADRSSLEELGDLAAKVASPLAAQGVKVVGICERDPADEARKACEQAGVSYPVLLDPGGTFFSQVATRRLPRTYLIDATGKILWFDIEYTAPTRHDLREALRALVAK
jgi:peroxiredoxin